MSTPLDDYAARREMLALEIARQRTQFAAAYRDLEKPIQYTENGIRLFVFFRQNPWIFVAAPMALNMVSSVFGWRKKSSPPAPRQSQSQSPRKGIIATCAGGAWELFQLYRRVRPYLP